MRGEIKLPDGRTMARFADWLNLIPDNVTASLPNWYMAEQKRTENHIPLYRRSEEHYGFDPLTEAELSQVWHDVLRHYVRVQSDPLEALITEPPVAGDLYLDTADITTFSRSTSLPNSYKSSAPEDETSKELPRSANLVIGALCDLFWRTKYPENTKINQSTIIKCLAEYGVYGMGERTLKGVLSPAIREFEEAKKSVK